MRAWPVVLLLLILPGASACTPGPSGGAGARTDLVVRDADGRELLRVDGGEPRSACSQTAPPAYLIDRHHLVWAGRAYHLATGRSVEVSGLVSLAGGRVLQVGLDKATVHDLANGTARQWTLPFQARFLSEGVASTMVQGRMQAHDLLANATLYDGAPPHGFPAGSGLVAMSANWTVFRAERTAWASRDGAPPHALGTPSGWTSWWAARIAGGRLVATQGYWPEYVVLDLETDRVVPESVLVPAGLKVRFERVEQAAAASTTTPTSPPPHEATETGEAVSTASTTAGSSTAPASAALLVAAVAVLAAAWARRRLP